MAALVKDEQITAFATVFAVSVSLAPDTLHSIILVAPSPSPAMHLHKNTVTVLSAFMNVSKSSPSQAISLFPAMPFAKMVTMSFVEVSPSTLTMLNVFCISPERAF